MFYYALQKDGLLRFWEGPRWFPVRPVKIVFMTTSAGPFETYDRANLSLDRALKEDASAIPPNFFNDGISAGKVSPTARHRPTWEGYPWGCIGWIDVASPEAIRFVAALPSCYVDANSEHRAIAAELISLGLPGPWPNERYMWVSRDHIREAQEWVRAQEAQP